MTRAIVVSLLLLPVLAACRHGAPPAVTPVSGHGTISIEVVPNPIVVKKVAGTTYDFPFEVVVKETGGRAVNITRVSITVFGPGGFVVGRDGWSADQLRTMGSSPNIAASSEVRYRFNQRREIPDERLLSGVTAELKVDAVDDAGTETSAKTSVTARK
jgi:hypothetical protein